MLGFFAQVLEELRETLSSLAICDMALPEQWTSHTASAFNSDEDHGFVSGIQHSLPRIYSVLTVRVSGGAGSTP
jgi:hypothetical protein